MKIIFRVTEDWVQNESLRLIGRPLTDEEMDVAGKCVDMGFLTSADIIITAAIREAVEIARARVP